MPPKPSLSEQFSEELQQAVQQIHDRFNQELQQTNSRVEQHQLDTTNKIEELRSMVAQLLKQGSSGTSSGEHGSTFGRTNCTPVRPAPLHHDGGGEESKFHRGQEQRISLPRTEFPLFDGFNPTAWKSKCENYFSIYQIPEHLKSQMAILHFSGEAQEWFDCFREECPDLPWPLLVEEVLDRFMAHSDSNPVGDFKRVCQTGKVTDYIRQFERSKARLIAETKISNTTFFVQGFIEGLKEEIRYAVEVHDPVTLNQAFNYARKAELNLEGIDRRNRTLLKNISYHPSKSFKESDPTKKDIPMNPFTKTHNSLGGKEMSREQMRALKLCYYCKEKYFPGHKCKMKTLLSLQAQESLPTEEAPSDDGDDSHQFIEWVTDASIEDSFYKEEAVITMCADPQPQKFHTLRFKGMFDQVPICILIDTGSTHSFINPSLVDTTKWQVIHTNPLHVRIANGAAMATCTKCDELTFTLQNHELTGAVRLLNIQGYDLILGMDWLSLHGPMTIDWNSGQVQLYEGEQKLTFKVQTEVAEVHFCQGELCTLTESKKGSLLMIAHIFHVTEDTTNFPPVHSLLQPILQQFAHVFQEPTSIPPVRAIDHQIPLQDSTKAVSIRPYRYSYFQKKEIDKIVEELLANSFIRPSTSPFSSPVLLVKKKDDSWRLCIDYRQLNENTIKNKYPIPIIDDLLDELKGAQCFSKIDLRSGYHQIRMAEDDIYKRAFRTHNGHFEFVVMPFGLTNAPATFQTLMNNLFKPYIRKFILVFFDDILIYSTSMEDHAQHVHTTLQILHSNQLYAKMSKCEFGLSQIEYLVHIISNKEVATDPKKIQTMLDWPVPKSVKALRGFLGLTGYYRKFVRNYGIIAKPLTDLTKKNAFCWNFQAQQAFERLKVAMSTALVLTLPDYSKKFTIETDASALGMGAVLMQDNKPIAFLSKRLGLRNQGLSTYEKEFLSLLTTVKKWRHYLVGSHFVIKTDQISLKHLLEQRVSTTLQHKGLCKLLGLDYSIEYKKGKENKVVDALSRVQGDNWHISDSSSDLWAVSEILPEWIHELLASYINDPWIAHLKQSIDNNSGDNHSDFSIHNGVLRFKGRICVGSSDG
ncbi:polyprotein [Rhynchospora pubera]|uniref:Polyprotein n=1 Tax=Rhynchospora pubera TaxID=906938 RepID=A0AAV8EHV8_9POAL|nr:polyprotein [Rhynchospora pubera]